LFSISGMPEGLNKDQVEKRLQGMYLLLIICRNHEFCHWKRTWNIYRFMEIMFTYIFHLKYCQNTNVLKAINILHLDMFYQIDNFMQTESRN